MGEQCVQVFFDKVTSVKIVSSVWLNINLLILSCDGNTILLYQVSEGKFVYLYLFFLIIFIVVIIYCILLSINCTCN